ncbi:M28 family metallopeptidase [Zongyangia hominis]|uniref:M28 family peptidase n=1 Tax=Zongyangia hominis TaxID=2763677 RepID=A0A926EDG5_9FIRM|nr:M28 family peptidase [Zongyangia hominis]MBC8570394.1 M28 family peptidase [Zongyangia hominis]
MKEGLAKTIGSTYGVRNSRRQKDTFLKWAQQMLAQEGIATTISVDPCLVRNRNLVIGDLSQAKTVVTAHYDTPKTIFFPIAIYLDSFWLSLLAQVWAVLLLIVVIMVLPAFLGVPFWARYAVFLLTLALFFFVFNNRKNLNDNSSGVAGVLECALRCHKERRNDVAFVLFDNEEWGLLGSAGFAKKYREEMRGKLVVNLDCIGAGDEIVLVSKKEALEDAKELAASAMREYTGKTVTAQLSGNMLAMSDHANFPRSMMVSAFHRDRLGRKLCRIHSWRDTVLEEKNMDLVCDLITEYLRKKSIQ